MNPTQPIFTLKTIIFGVLTLAVIAGIGATVALQQRSTDTRSKAALTASCVNSIVVPLSKVGQGCKMNEDCEQSLKCVKNVCAK